jgi:hypothetical protein
MWGLWWAGRRPSVWHPGGVKRPALRAGRHLSPNMSQGRQVLPQRADRALRRHRLELRTQYGPEAKRHPQPEWDRGHLHQRLLDRRLRHGAMERHELEHHRQPKRRPARGSDGLQQWDRRGGQQRRVHPAELRAAEHNSGPTRTAWDTSGLIFILSVPYRSCDPGARGQVAREAVVPRFVHRTHSTRRATSMSQRTPRRSRLAMVPGLDPMEKLLRPQFENK